MTELTPNTTGTAIPAIRLEYGTEQPTAPPARRGRRVVPLLALLPGLALPFLPFECDLSPAKAVGYGALELVRDQSLNEDELAVVLLALPFFLIVPIFVRAVRQLLGRPTTRLGRRVAYAIGAAGALAFAGSLSLLTIGNQSAYAWSLIVGGIAALAVVAWLQAVLFNRQDCVEERVTVAVVGPYAVTLVFCIVAWAEHHQIGWYFAIAPAAAATVELIAIVRSLRRRRPGTVGLAARPATTV